MRWERRLLALLAAAALVGAPAIGSADEPAEAGGDEVQEQLWLMQQKLKQMEDQLDATNRRLSDAQRQLRDLPEPAAPAGPGLPGGVAGFLNRLEIGGWVSGEYFYNFNDPDGELLDGANQGFMGSTNPFSGDANSFQFSQLWLSLEHPVSPEHRAGFKADIVFGNDADELDGFAGGAASDLSGSDTALHVYEAYVQYLAPVAVGDGVHLKFGKFGTLLGAETVHDSPDANFNITRSNVFNLLQPITHVGLLASTNFEGGLDFAAGVVNQTRGGSGGTGLDVDINNNKALTGHLGWTGETAGVSLNTIWGSNSFGDEEADELIVDLILSLDPTEELSTYLNFDYLTTDSDGVSKGEAWGVSWAGKLQITEKLSQALRLDFVDDDGMVFAPGFGDVHIWTVTAPTAYEIAENLTLRAEARYDDAEIEDGPLFSMGYSGSNRNDFFISDSSSSSSSLTEGHQVLVGAQIVYSF